MISNRCYYALRAMLELAIREGDGPVSIAAIAEAQEIPSRFLEAILRQLRQGGFAESARGKEGGYFLSRPAPVIKVGDVIRLFEGPLVEVSPVANGGATGHPAGSAMTDVFREVWVRAESALASVYDAVNFGDLAARERMRRSGGIANYAI